MPDDDLLVLHAMRLSTPLREIVSRADGRVLGVIPLLAVAI
jgi:hypothetical protein